MFIDVLVINKIIKQPLLQINPRIIFKDRRYFRRMKQWDAIDKIVYTNLRANIPSYIKVL